MIKRVTQGHVLDAINVPDAINVLDVFCSCYTLLFQLLAKHSSAALPCKRFVYKRV